MIDATFYHCRSCGSCCRWSGYVALGTGEAERVAGFLGLELAGFLERYTALRPDRRGLMFTVAEDGACIFLDAANRCRIDPVKPEQCRGFPNRWRVPGWRERCRAVALLARGPSRT